jgi:intracellular sulfur oxidation DsrE/DsrF family protein
VGGVKRRLFLGSALAGTLPAYAVAASPPGGLSAVEPHSAFDERAFEAAVARPARIRQMWENVALKPAVLSNIKNSLNGLQFGYLYPPHDIASAVVNHGPSAAYTYGDLIWAKYRIAEYVGYNKPVAADSPLELAAHGALRWLGREVAEAPVLKNPFYQRKNKPSANDPPEDDDSVYQDTSIEALQSRGVVFLTCHTAVMEQAKSLVKGGYAPSGMAAKDVAAEILTHLIPGAIVVPSGVATVAVLQQVHRYTYITIQS